jgi:hypothetical protein
MMVNVLIALGPLAIIARHLIKLITKTNNPDGRRDYGCLIRQSLSL